MLRAEYLGVKEMAETQTIRVPKPIAFGDTPDGRTSFVLMEYLSMTSSSGNDVAWQMGRQLAQMHRHTSAKGFGFPIDNTIGATPQPNTPWMEDWADFWDRNRLGHMLKLTDDCGLSSSEVDALRTKTRALLSHNPKPSLLHGDLWGGNKGYATFGEEIHPVIFDPATYYGDREADLAMTELFGGFSSGFYQGYNEEWPILHEGYNQRKVVYNLYHM
jgi:fructosamine-3-kinase